MALADDNDPVIKQTTCHSMTVRMMKLAGGHVDLVGAAMRNGIGN